MATEQELADAEIEAARQQVDRQAAVVAAIVLEAVTQGATHGGSSSQLMMVWPPALEKAVASLSKLTAIAAVTALLPRKKRGSGAGDVGAEKVPDRSGVTPTRDELLEQILPGTTTMVRKIVEQDIVEPARRRQLKEMRGHDAPQTAVEARHWSDLIGRTAATRAASEIAVAMAEPIQKKLETELVKVWLSRGDSRVRDLHRKLHAQTARMGDPFWRELGTGRELRYPGDPKAPIEQVANCRCHLFLARADEARAAEEVFHMDDSEFALAASGHHVLYGLAVADLRAARAAPLIADGRPGPDDAFDGMVVVLIPEGLDDIEYADGDKAPAHSTLAYLGNLSDATDEEIDDIRATAQRAAETVGPFSAKVAGKATLGDMDDEVLLVEAKEIQDLHDTMAADPTVGRLLAERNEHPHFIPHITYPHVKAPDEIKFVKIGCWIGDDKQEFDL